MPDISPAPLAYARETILTAEQLAEWLQVSRDTVDRMEIPRLIGFGRYVRFSAGSVLDYLEGRTKSA